LDRVGRCLVCGFSAARAGHRDHQRNGYRSKRSRHTGGKVTLVNTATQFTRAVETNAAGQYVAPSIPTGPYKITVVKSGFQRLERTGIQLATASTLTVDMQLVIGHETQSISVTESAPLVQDQSATVSGLVTTRQISDLPLATRDFTDLVLLAPGAHAGSASNLAEGGSPYAMRAGANYSVNGSLPQANSYLIDGVYNRNLWLNTLIMVPVVDAIQEYRVMTSNYAAEYGESAGSVTEVNTKSGTNAFHGDVWEFFRNNELNANTFFNNANGITRPGFRRNEFGATFGGPIIQKQDFLLRRLPGHPAGAAADLHFNHSYAGAIANGGDGELQRSWRSHLQPVLDDDAAGRHSGPECVLE
jgi:hypothetical protein